MHLQVTEYYEINKYERKAVTGVMELLWKALGDVLTDCEV